MKIYHTGLHYACIADLKDVFEKLGHQYDFDSYSGHNHLMGWPTRENWLLQGDHWLTEFEKNEFWNRYWDDNHDRLDQYDAFVVSYPFMWSWLYKKFNKPVIAHIPIRYEYGLVHKPEEWGHFNSYVQERVDSGQLILTANSKFDKIYTETFLQRETKHIPTLGAFANMPYSGGNPNFLFYLRNGWPGITGAIPNVVSRESQIGNGYQWNQLGQYAGIVHCPYAVSTMSCFEFYTNCIPTYIPSHSLVCEWYANNVKSPNEKILWHWNNKSLFKEQPNCTPAEVRTDFAGAPDPNNRDSIDSFRHWTQYCDFYDQEWFKETQLFNSVQHLQEMLTQQNARAVHDRMKAENPGRTQRIMDLWSGVLADVQGKIG